MAIPTRVRSLFATGLIASLAWPACGGGTPEPTTAERADADEHRSSSESDDESSPSASEPDEGTTAKKKPACDDGTCTLCGEGQCPIGWFCDEGAKGGPACAWLPECAKKPTCACVKRVFPGSCEERNGGLYVKE